MRTRRAFRAAFPLCLLLAGTACQNDDAIFQEVAPADELWAQAQEQLEGIRVLGVFPYVNYDEAIETLQTIVDNYPYSEYAVKSELEIADAYFLNRKYEEALSYYRDFSQLHPEHERVPYTLWQAALCHERQRLSPERDQSATRDALVFLDKLLLQHPRSEYSLEAEELWRELQTGLAEHVQGIADFYYERGEYESAAERYRALLNEYPGLGLDARVLFKLGESYAALRRHDEADRIYRTLITHYADSHYAYRARRQLSANLP